jgi:hypothetical protein
MHGTTIKIIKRELEGTCSEERKLINPSQNFD